MLIVVVAVAIVVSVPLFGGSHAALARLRLRGTWLVAGALVIQIAIISVFDIGGDAVSRSLHVVTYLMIGVCLVLNRAVRGMWLVTVGWLSNFAAIVVNGGVMPTSASAAAAFGRTASDGFANSEPSSHARLAFLGDIFPTPRGVPLANIFSIGDVILLAGLVFVIVCASRAPDREPALT
jgi:hypothetical protein